MKKTAILISGYMYPVNAIGYFSIGHFSIGLLHPKLCQTSIVLHRLPFPFHFIHQFQLYMITKFTGIPLIKVVHPFLFK